MGFYERYAELITEMGIDPCSMRAANMFGINKGTISSWKIKGTSPRGETVARMADILGVSADYLLGRTDRRTDDSRNSAQAIIQEVIKKREREEQKERDLDSEILRLYNRLRPGDQQKAEGFIRGLLAQDVYQLNAAHERTDIDVTDDMIRHDDEIMDDPDF